VADSLCPNEIIEYLKVQGFRGNRLPSWFNRKDLQNLRRLELFFCHCFGTLTIPNLLVIQRVSMQAAVPIAAVAFHPSPSHTSLQYALIDATG
jgi:hypothetical protein